jgi:two-component system response regulator WspF
VDAVNTPVLGRDNQLTGGEELVRKMRSVMRLQCSTAMQADIAPAEPLAAAAPDTGIHVPLVVIGASTGGPQALEKVLLGLKRPLPFSIVVVQHLDPLFVPGLAEWLNQETGLTVQLIREGDPPAVGTVHLASTSDHVVVRGGGRLSYVKEPQQHVYRPSVDVFFASLLRHRVPAGVAVLLTGMGRDGATGLKSLQEAGWKTIAQDQETSIVWGMPGAAANLGAADRVLPADQIGPAITAAASCLCGSQR